MYQHLLMCLVVVRLREIFLLKIYPGSAKKPKRQFFEGFMTVEKFLLET